MISAIQPAGMVLIVKIILMLITGTCFVNGEYCGMRVASCGLRVAGCDLRGPASQPAQKPAGKLQIQE